MKQFAKIHSLLVATLILASFLRLYHLGTNPPSLDWDEASLGYNAYSLLKTGADEYGNTWPLSIRSFNDYKPPLYTYLTIPAVALFGLSEFAVRLPSALAGVIAVAAAYFLSIELFKDHRPSRSLALTSSFLLTISPWHLQFSRAAFEANLALTFYLLSVTFFLKWVNLSTNKNHQATKPYSHLLFILLSSLCASASFYSYHSARLVVPLLFLSFALIFRKLLLARPRHFLASLALSLALLFPLLYIGTRGYAADRLGSTSIFTAPQNYFRENERLSRLHHYDVTAVGLDKLIPREAIGYAQIIIRNYFEHFNFNFLFLTGDANPRHSAAGMGVLYLSQFPLLLYGAYRLIVDKPKFAPIIWLLLLIAPLPAAITQETPHAIRSLLMLPALTIITAYGFVSMYQAFAKKRFGSLPIISYSLLLTINFVVYLNLYFVITPEERSQAWQYGYKQLVQKVGELEPGYDRLVITTKYDQPHIYFAFYQQIDPKLYQTYAQTASRNIGQYYFVQDIPAYVAPANQKTLLIGAPHQLRIETPFEQIDFLDGSPAFLFYNL